MLLEATDKPIRYRLHTGEEVYLKPGVPTELPEQAGRQLLRKAGGKVRMIKPVQKTECDLAGQIVSWESPLFGLLSATALEDLPNGVRVFHPLTEVECVIPRGWVQPPLSQRPELRPPDPAQSGLRDPLSHIERPD